MAGLHHSDNTLDYKQFVRRRQHSLVAKELGLYRNPQTDHASAIAGNIESTENCAKQIRISLKSG